MGFDGVGGLPEQVEALPHGGIVADAYVAQVAEVCREFYLEPVGQAVLRVMGFHHFSHEDSRWEHRGVSACHDGVAVFKLGVSRYVVDVGLVGGATAPVQVSEVSAALYGAAAVRARALLPAKP